MASSSPHYNSLSVRPPVRGQAPAAGAGWALPPWGFADSGFLRTVCSHARAPKTSKGAETSAPKPREGKGRNRGASDQPLPGPPDPRGVPKRGGFPVLSGGECGPSPRRDDTGFHPLGDHLGQRCGVDHPEAHLPVPGSRPCAGPEFRPHIASSGSRRKQLESGTGSLANPPRTHPLSRLQVGRGPPLAGFRPQGWLGPLDWRRRIPPGAEGAAVSRHPFILSHFVGCVVCRAQKTGSVNSIRDVTASQPQRMG